MNKLSRTGSLAPKSATLAPMAASDSNLRDLLAALDEPALIIERQLVRIANDAARALMGQAIEGGDVRLAIRHPQVLEFVLARKAGDIDFTGVGAAGRPWRLAARRIGDDALLLRHELRTPLTAVLGYSESLADEDLDPALASRFAGTIRSEARRMLRVIEDLMSLSRVEADRFVAPTDAVDVSSILRSSVESVRATARECGCDIHLDLQDDLPPVSGDFPQLVQIVDNLLNNAVRYGCAVPKCKIRLSAEIDNQWIRIEVSDTGPGIPRDHLPFLTRRFYRVDAARSRDSGGTGLGLAIVKHIVERHRGLLSIDSIVGEGTTVTVRLPIHN